MIRLSMVPRVVILALVSVLVPAAAEAGVKVLARTVVVHLDEGGGETGSYYHYLASIPAAVYSRNGETFQGAILGDDVDLAPNTYFLQDWAAWLTPQEATSDLFVVGGVGDAARQAFIEGLRPDAVHDVGAGSAAEVAVKIARIAFRSASMAVLAPAIAGPDDADIENAANAAAFASRNDVPLFFMAADALAPETVAAMRELGVKEVVVFDAAARLGAQTLRPLAAGDIAVREHIRTAKDMVARLLDGTPVSTICFMENGPKGLAAALGAARYQGVVLRIPGSVTRAAVRAYAAIPILLLSQREKLDKPYNLEDFPVTPRDGAVVDDVYAYLQGLGADNPAALERILLFAQGSEHSGVPLTLDRSLVGDPGKPDQRGALIGRMPGSAQENIAFLNRSTLYRALIFANPRPTHVTMHMVAYEVENTSEDCSYDFVDPEGKTHKVNEYYGVHEGAFDDPGVYVDMKAKGYDLSFHDGRNPGPTAHPINEGRASSGFWKDLRDGSGYFYVSCHGGTDEIYTLDEDNGTCEDVSWGTPLWPDPSGRVNVYGDGYSAQDFDRDFENLHSSVNIFNACLVGGGAINPTLLRHGAAASIASYISVSFDGAGMFNCLFSDRFSDEGITLGQAFAHATARTSQIWPAGQTSGDSSLRFVLFGDPNMEFIKPGWTRPEATGIATARNGR